MSSEWPGVGDAAHAQPAPLPLARLGDDLDAVARAQLVLVHDVVVVGVRAEDRRRASRPRPRPPRRAAPTSAPESTKTRRPALPVRDHEGVGEPVGMHAPLDQHGARLTGTPEEEKAWPV